MTLTLLWVSVIKLQYLPGILVYAEMECLDYIGILLKNFFEEPPYCQGRTFFHKDDFCVILFHVPPNYVLHSYHPAFNLDTSI